MPGAGIRAWHDIAENRRGQGGGNGEKTESSFRSRNGLRIHREHCVGRERRKRARTKLRNGPTSMKTFRHGVHPPENKDATEHKSIRRLPFPAEVIVPLVQHTGAPAKAIVREGQEVVRGEPIAEPGGFVSVPMHAPVTGVVDRIDTALAPNGTKVPAIYIKAYPGASQEVLYGAPQNIDTMSQADLVKAVQATGVVGLGGAAFPTHVKLSLPEGKKVDTVVVNGCECEPYLTTDHRIMLEHPESVVMGARIIMKAIGASRVIIGTESNKQDAAEALRQAIQPGDPIQVEVVETKYPQGAEKMLIKALVNRDVPSGGLPLEIGVGVFNVATLAQIGELLPKRQGLIERVVTITGPGVKEPGNFMVPLGTPLSFALKFTGFEGSARQIVLGGPMMGVSAASLDIPITKGITSILVLTEAQVAECTRKTYPCIRCASCVQACPMHLNPSQLGLLADKREYEDMTERYHLMDCFECGSCAYVCPSNIPLVQKFRVAKSLVRERKAAACR